MDTAWIGRLCFGVMLLGMADVYGRFVRQESDGLGALAFLVGLAGFALFGL